MPEPAEQQALSKTICDEAVRVWVQCYGDQLRALVLTGSLARDEATWISDPNGWSVLGDAEFLAVFHEHLPLPSQRDAAGRCRVIEDTLLRHRIRCHIGVGPVYPGYLRRLEPRMLAYELRTCGQVVWGDPEILSLIRPFTISEIPLEDAWRTLCNRMIELLNATCAAPCPQNVLPQELGYRTIKLYLDMASSLLIFAGAYAPTYGQRQQRIQALAHTTPKNGFWPFPLGAFAARVAAATACKVGSEPVTGEGGWELWLTAVDYAHRLWQWELERLTGAANVSDSTLWQRWARLQPTRCRLRGWASALRRRGWRRSCRDWPRWARLAWRASPRYWIYGAGSALFFMLPSLLSVTGPSTPADVDCEDLRSWLPLTTNTEVHAGCSRWRLLASEIAWNYHELLGDTRA